MSKDDLSSNNNLISLRINGNDCVYPDGLGLQELLIKFGFNPRLVAIEYNGDILHRQFWANTMLKHGDQLEVVTIVGGG